MSGSRAAYRVSSPRGVMPAAPWGSAYLHAAGCSSASRDVRSRL